MAKKRLTRKEMKEDKLAGLAQRVLKYVTAHPRRIRGVVAGIVAFAAIVLALWAYVSSVQQKALDNLSEAEDIYKEAKGDEEYHKAKEAFQTVLEHYPWSKAARLALFYKGDCQYKLKEYQEAENTFKVFVDKYSRHPLTPFVLLNLAGIYEARNDYGVAIKVYETILSKYPQHGVAPLAQLAKGGCLEQLKKLALAEESYQRVLSLYPTSEWAEEAKERLEVIK
ncbi:MAG: tetratricopeptide repeat protein [bacterium]